MHPIGWSMKLVQHTKIKKNIIMGMTNMNIMNKPTISTIIIIICIIIIGLYAMGEVNYYSSKVIAERNVDAPTILIPSIGVNEKINNESLNLGVMHDISSSFLPTYGDTTIYGHRTLQGSPFLRLNELNPGDQVVLEWPGIGELTYTVVGSTVVPATSNVQAAEGGNTLRLITCDPIGSTENRLIVESQLQSQNDINNTIIQNNPQESNALMITAIFLIVGLIFSFFYPKDNRAYILATVLIISAILFMFCITPIPSEIIYSKINWLSGGL